MNLDILTEFLQQDLGYKDCRVIRYHIIGNNLHLELESNMLYGKFGELVKLDRWSSWISKKREEKLNKII